MPEMLTIVAGFGKVFRLWIVVGGGSLSSVLLSNFEGVIMSSLSRKCRVRFVVVAMLAAGAAGSLAEECCPGGKCDREYYTVEGHVIPVEKNLDPAWVASLFARRSHIARALSTANQCEGG